MLTRFTVVNILQLRSLSDGDGDGDGDGNENGKKTECLDWQNTDFARVHFFTVSARLRR